MSSMVTVTCEQAVYGSFSFRDQGYGILTASPGCRPEWLSAFARYCRELGQPPSEITPRIDRLLFARKIASGPWVVALGSAQGCDDRGRPGAWAFHGFFLSGRDFYGLDYSPFRLLPFLRDRFDPALSLPGGPLTVNIEREIPPGSFDPAMIRWVGKGKRLRRICDADAFASTEAFWNSLPPRVRRKRSMTTWAFRSDSPFHWACVGSSPPSEVDDLRSRKLWHFVPGEESKTPERQLRFSATRLKYLGVGIAAMALTIFAMRAVMRQNPQALPSVDSAAFASKDGLPPSPVAFRSNPVPAGTKDYVAERLTDWAERLESDPAMEQGFNAVMSDARRIVRAVRYQGPLLPNEFETIVEGDDRVRLMRNYAAVIARLAAVRAWPADSPAVAEADDPRFVLATMAWCVRDEVLVTEAGRIETVGDAKAWLDRFSRNLVPATIPENLPATGLESRFPELVEYRLQLSRMLRLR